MNQQIMSLIFATVTFCSATFALAQLPSVTKTGTFEVASVKPSAKPQPNPLGFPVRFTFRIEPGGMVRASQITLRELIMNAYDLPPFRVDGGPGWINSDRFEVMAAPEPGFSGTIEDVRGMVRALLSERFKLRVHTENRESPVYHLVLARKDGKLGTQLRSSTTNCEAVRSRRAPGREPPAGGLEPSCRPSFDANVREAAMTELEGESMEGFARTLQSEARRTVLDRTGLAGTFDIQLAFTPEPLPGLPRMPGSENGLSLFTAMQEQLGLKLEADRAPVEVLVIDSAEKPTQN
jgi:uncharacterized protein (TIGR03435 family)